MSDKPTNKEFAATDKLFRRACETAGVEPTARQASKWRNRTGAAFHHHSFYKKGGQS